MAMVVEAQVLDPLRLTHKTCRHHHHHHHHHQNPYKTSTKAFEIKVMYVRIISPTCMHGNIEITFPARDLDARLRVNGTKIGPVEPVSMTMNKNRVDALMSESIHISTNAIRFRGSSLAFELRAQGCFFPFVVGVVRRREAGCMWVMECREGGNCYGSSFDGGMVDVYFAGRRMDGPLLLNGVVELKRRRWTGLVFTQECNGIIGDDSKRFEEESEGKEHGDLLKKPYNSSSREEMFEEEEEEDGELSWFSAGVRVGMGLGLGMCLGVGVGLGLVFRTYQAATGAFRRFI